MKSATTLEAAVNSKIIPPGSRIYCSGNAATPQKLLGRLAGDESIRDVDLYCVLPLGEQDVMRKVFGDAACSRINYRIIFNSGFTREAVNAGKAKYQLWHLSQTPRQIRRYVKPNVVLLQVSGPDYGGNYSLGTTVEAVLAAIHTAKETGGIVIAERNLRMPFVLGPTVPEHMIDYFIDVDYPLPASPAAPIDDTAQRIARIITRLYIEDGSTLQFGIGGVPEAVADAIIEKGVKDLGIHTEVLASAMIKLIRRGIVTNKKNRRKGDDFSIGTVFLADSKEDYDWLHFNSSVQGRASNYTNSILVIAQQPNMVAINSAIGVDLAGNIWADSMTGRQIYSGIGGQADFIRAAPYSEGGRAVIALKATTGKGVSKIVDMCPEGITTTAIPADQVILVSEYGAFEPFGLSVGEKAVGIAHLAAPEFRDELLGKIYSNPAFHDPKSANISGRPKGFTPYDKAG
ncbi:MAG: acetyl-CoA hydrolase/transferase C-terminal domain-containing protein [Elusimicrobiota bacterium]